jgi:hypothetical protein
MKRVLPREGEAVVVTDRYGSYPSSVMPSDGAVLVSHHRTKRMCPLSRFALGYTPIRALKIAKAA